MPHGSESVVAPLAARRLAALGAPELYGYPAFRPAPLLIPDAEPGPAPVRNRLLAALPGSQLALLEPYLEPVWLEQRAQLFAPDRPIGHVYFPDTAVISLVSRLDDGRTVELIDCPKELQKPGARAEIDADAKRVEVSIGMVGDAVYVRSFRLI